MRRRILSPSMLSADFGHLERDTRMINRSDAQWIHIDVMDGVFVPNISFGFPVLKAIKKAASKFIDTHLMIADPDRYAGEFVEAGSDLVTVHLEAAGDIRACIRTIKDAGGRAGVSIKPATPVRTLYGILDDIDLVLIMSVEPGFGGQKFMEGSLGKIRDLRTEIDRRGLDVLIEADGGISRGNAAMLYDAGCDALVAGNAVFSAKDPEEEIRKILNARME